ncbi:MAG TPA: carboxypeptidase-like regulatory domain-containing protein [Candidatus Sulfotelmatobacter sp.]|nr:carboxypeptidase-like regulatory domain-containing protein [Candidatus Sulfotelmatobacter sp.]
MAQEVSTAAKANSRAVIEGIVTKDPDSQPVKKAIIELIAENQAEGGDYTATTGVDGSFRIENILPGRYHLFAERTGLLDSGRQHSQQGRILTLAAGQEVKDLQIRLQASAVIRGRVTDEDGDPMRDAEVSVFRPTFVSGRRHWEQAGAERTNDLGEYRIANLAAGNVYVSVSPPPDFRSLIEAAGAAANQPRAAEKPSTSYQTTFYPGTTDRSQAASIQLHSGDDYPINFSLIPAPALSIHGSVVNLPQHTTATIMLQSRDFNVVMNGAEMHKDGSFVIRDVSPGSYTISATVDGAPVPMMARQSLQMGSNNVDGLRLAPQPGAVVHGWLGFESNGARKASEISLALRSLDGDADDSIVTSTDAFTNLAHVAANGSFEWKDVPPGNYYVQMLHDTDENAEWYIKSALAGGRDVNESGISVNGGAVMLDLVASADGGNVSGVVLDNKSQPVANAIVAAVPDVRLRGHADHFKKTVSDQSGHFSLRGIRPGNYTVFAWESVDGDAYYNPDFLKTFEGQGKALGISEREQQTVQLTAIPEPEDQP